MDTGTDTASAMRPDADSVPRHDRTAGLLRSGLALSALAVPAVCVAQAPPVPGNAGALPALAAVPEGGAGGDAGKPAWVVTPRMSVTETFTDNAVVAAGGPRQSDQITQFSPGIRIGGSSGRLRASIDYALNYLVNARGTSPNRTTNSLNATGNLEAIERWLYVDMSGIVTQQNISAFGAQTAGTATTSANTTETSTFRISPFVRGNLARVADYEVRLSHAETRSGANELGNVTTDEFIVRLRGLVAPVGFGWALDASTQNVAYSGGATNRNDLVRATLNYRLNAEFQVRGSVGSESNNYTNGQTQNGPTHGYGADWTPTERTQVSVFREKRFFGDSHTLSVNHRMPFTVIRFVDTRSITTTPPSQTGAGQGTYYDLLFAQLANAYPDPVVRAQQVSAQLAQSGIAPTATVTNGFLASTATVNRRQELSFVINGLRNTVTYTLFQSDQESIGAAGIVASDFSTTNRVRQRGMSSNFSHRLTPLTALNVLSSWTNSESAGGLSTTTRVMNVNVTTRLGAKTSANVGLRATRTDGAAAYRENAVLTSLTTTF